MVLESLGRAGDLLSGLTVGVLGQLEVSVRGRAVRLTTGRLRTLLAVLAMAAGRTVSLERLTAAVWAEDTPAHPRRSLQTYAARLRAELGDGLIMSRTSGLALDVDTDAVDALRFEQTLDDATRQPDPDRERQLLDDALGLWRGEPFEGVTSRWLSETEAPRLVERRLTALERRVDLDLAAGRHGELVGELNEWSARHPMRETLWVRLLIALDRSGRRADALERYQHIRLRIADELGVDPSQELQQVYAGLLVDRSAGMGSAPTAEPPTPVTVPQQLPGPPPTFIGRTAELAQVADMGDASAVVITAIDGMAGVGKTALAIHAARRLAGRYPDGQLFLDLHGFTEGVTPVDPSEALGRTLRSLGVPGEQIPPQLDDRAALYRSRLADQRMLIVLDNAVTESQVTPLLPGNPGCLVLITSRRRLAGLDQTHAVSLDVLSRGEAVNLFSKTVGADRLVGETSQTLVELVELCGRLPLALRIAAARLRARRTWTVQNLIDRLYDRQQRLVELEAGQRSIVAALDLSYQQLTADERRGYRLIGIHPGSDLDLHAAAALIDSDLQVTRRLVDQLVDAHLLQEITPDRYQFHDLTRNHAALTATREEPEPARGSALNRLFTHYVHVAAAAMNAAYPFEQERRPQPPESPHAVPDVSTSERAAAWLDVELANLLAAARYSHEHGWLDYPPLLADTLSRHLLSRSHTGDTETLHTWALAAARSAGEPVAEINALVRLGLLHRLAGQHPQAEVHYRGALQLALDRGYPHGELDALHGLAQMQRLQSQYAEAIGSFERALDIAATVEYPTGELEALIGLGHVYEECNQHELANKYLRQGLGLARDTGHQLCEQDALIGLGWIQLAHDDIEGAADDFGRALDIARDGGHRIGEMSALIGLGGLHRKQGRHEAAAGYYEDVLGQARQVGKPNWIFEALQGLGRIRLSMHRPDDALACHREALDTAEQMRQPSDIARAHDGLAHAHHARREHADARLHWQRALDIFTELGLEGAEDWEATVPSIRAHLASYDTQADS